MGDSIQGLDWHRLPVLIVLLDRIDFTHSFIHSFIHRTLARLEQNKDFDVYLTLLGLSVIFCIPHQPSAYQS